MIFIYKNNLFDKYKPIVEETKKYILLEVLRTGEYLPNKKRCKVPHIKIKHLRCESEYYVAAAQFINVGKRCGKCCGKYENSFAYYIEVGLNLNINDVWDEKNTVNPYHIYKNSSKKVWIKCQDKDYHGSYQVTCNRFVKVTTNSDKFGCPYCASAKVHPFDSFAQYHINNTNHDFLDKYWDYDKNKISPWDMSPNTHKTVWVRCNDEKHHESYSISCNHFTSGKRCPYCASRKIHPKDSFAQYHIDNTDPDFLEKYWDWDKNTLNPWELSPMCSKKIWIKCQEKDYHDAYKVSCDGFTSGNRCSYCNPSGKHPKIHTYDSFGYRNFDKVQSWHPDNNISPFKVAYGSKKKYKFICESCGCVFDRVISSVKKTGMFCLKCSSSKGEKIVIRWLNSKDIKYIHDEPYFKNLLSNKGNPLRPDFILPDHKIWIEYDGEFHYKKMYDDDGYEVLQIHDKLKDEYAKKHRWKMIRIPYWEFDNIEDILEREVR